MTMEDHHVLETNDRFRRFADSVPLLMCVLDPELKGLYFNQQWLSFTGHQQGDLTGNRWLEDIHPQDREHYVETCRQALESWNKFDVECRLHRHDGEFRYIRHTGTPQFSENGQLLNYVDTAVDVTPRKVAEDALRQTESRCRALFGPSIGNVAVVDCAGRIIGLNDGWMRFARQYGGRLRFVGVGVNYLEVCQHAAESGDHEAVAARQGLLDVLDGSVPEFRLEYSCATPAEELWYEMIIHPLQRLEGGAIITHLNITTRRRAELQAQTLLHELAHVSRVAVLGELTASFAHELSQPLTAIQTNVQAAKHLLAQKSSAVPDVEELLSDILADNLRAGKILQQLRALLKKDPVRFRPVKLNKLIRDVADLLHDEAVLKKVKVSLRLDPALPQVEGERIQLQQVILNLMVNAFEAMKKGGGHQRELTITTGVEGCDHVAILARDTGPGIPEDRLDRVFEPFFTTKTEGLGMGLAICRSIIELHKGKISVANNEEKGVTFRVVLPVPGKENL
jgi:two-component system sensor kinase FixL